MAPQHLLPVNASLMRSSSAAFPSGVIAVCAIDNGTPVGMAVNSFTSVSLDPPLVSICVQLSSTTWSRLRQRTQLGLSVLADSQDEACRELARKTGDRFAGLGWREGTSEAVLIDGAAAWFECSLHEELRVGDHYIVVLRVHRLNSGDNPAPLVFHGSRFRKLAQVDADTQVAS